MGSIEQTFADYEDEAHEWITIVEADHYPDYLEPAKERYEDEMQKFGELIEEVDSSADIIRELNERYTTTDDERTQLLRIFRRYVLPDISVEITKKKKNETVVTEDYADRLRDIEKVRENFNSRPMPDETLAAILDQHSDRGFKGYYVEDKIFEWFEENFSDEYEIDGPRGAGQDVLLKEELEGWEEVSEEETPVDFVLYGPDGEIELIGVARYDSDRGGGQESDRTGGNANTVKKVVEYSRRNDLDIKMLLVNDGPGLLAGKMWRMYSQIERYADNVKVCTLKMLDGRISEDWVLSDPITESDGDVINEEVLEDEESENGEITASDGGVT